MDRGGVAVSDPAGIEVARGEVALLAVVGANDDVPLAEVDAHDRASGAVVDVESAVVAHADDAVTGTELALGEIDDVAVQRPVGTEHPAGAQVEVVDVVVGGGD